MVKECSVVEKISNELSMKKRYFINIFGSGFSKNGNPDFLTNDKNGRLLAIEAKAPKKSLVVNQWRNALLILRSGGRFIVAQDDFDLEKVDDDLLEVFFIRSDFVLGETEFDLVDTKILKTIEIKLCNR